ncbi:hypothetical protein DFS34DRAFT_58766 [Phlyctochytrium arcticum]|nr:hypothetical protein DFS34DRAFT_280935 [Phlyctochytrium arcticum]KAI9106316.1 hypothetical protein DFS34DRAFT_58766 [Phlyctochytrium arcticum]
MGKDWRGGSQSVYKLVRPIGSVLKKRPGFCHVSLFVCLGALGILSDLMSFAPSLSVLFQLCPILSVLSEYMSNPTTMSQDLEPVSVLGSPAFLHDLSVQRSYSFFLSRDLTFCSQPFFLIFVLFTCSICFPDFDFLGLLLIFSSHSSLPVFCAYPYSG